MSDAHEALHRLRNQLGRTSAACEDVDQLTGQAIAYVWGWKDAGGQVHAKDGGDLFGQAYGVTVARSYLFGKARPSIQDAWQSWQRHGEIRLYEAGSRLDIYSEDQQEVRL